MRVDAAGKRRKRQELLPRRHAEAPSTAKYPRCAHVGTAVITDVVTEIVAEVVLVVEQSLWWDRVGVELLARRMEMIDY